MADRVNEVAAARGVPAAQVALAWLLHRPGVTAPIVGATKVSHLEDALAAEQLDLRPRRWPGWKSRTCRIPPSATADLFGRISRR